MRIWHIGALALAVVVGYIGYWFYAASRVESGILAWAEARRAAGDRVEWRSLHVGGFPFRLDTTFEAPEIELAELPERPTWTAERLVGIVQPWNFRHVLANVDGRHVLTLQEPSGERKLGIGVGHGRAGYRIAADGRPEVLSLDLKQVDAWDSRRPGHLSAGHVLLHLRPSVHPGGLLDAAATVQQATLPDEAAGLLGRMLERLDIDLTVTGTAPAADAVPAMAAAWRDGGGTVELRSLTARWDGQRLDAAGTLALDGEGRPIGALTARLHGHEKLLERLTAAGLLPPDRAATAKSLLGVLAAANGGVLSVPVGLQDGWLYLGPAQLARLSPLWPADGRNPPPGSPARRQ